MTAQEPDRVPLESLLVHRAWIRALARSLVSDPNRADDVEQETWRLVLERPPRHAGALRAWFGTVVRNVAQSMGRGETRRARRETAQAERPREPSPPDVVAEAELQQRLAAAVLALDEPYRSTVLHRWFEGKEPAQIAAETGVPVATVRTRMKRGVAMLRARMHADVGDDREAWCLLLSGSRHAPSASGTGAAAAIAGEAAMGWGTRIAAAASLVLVAGVAGVLLTRRTDGDRVIPPTAGVPSDAPSGRNAARGSRSETPRSDESARAPAPAAEAGDLRGTVVRADGTPVAGARVESVTRPWTRVSTMNWRGFAEIRTESATVSAADGTFSATTRGEPVRLRVSADGCAVRLAGSFADSEPVRVVVGPAVTLRAEVRDESGAPVVAARLLLLSRDDGQGDAGPREAATDGTGLCVFDGLVGGTRVTILPSAAVGAFGDVRVELPQTGETTVRIVSPAGTALRGRVIDGASRSPVAGAVVGHKLGLLCGATTDADGQFVLSGWTPDRFGEVQVVARGYARACVALRPDAPNEIELVRGFTLSGRAVDPSGSPIAGALVAVESTDRANRRRVSCGFAETVDDGRFRVDDLTRDLPHVLATASPAGALVRRSVAAPGADGPDAVDLGDLTLSGPRSIGGLVSGPEDSAAPRVSVRLRGPLDGAGASLGADAAVTTDAAGKFRFGGLAPGNYVVSADTPGAAGVEVAVDVPADRDVVGVRLPPESCDAPIVVHVKDDAGAPLAGVRLVAWRAGSSEGTGAVSDADGVARFATSDARPFERISASNTELADPDLQTVAGVTSYDLVVARTARVTCRLLDAEGRPIENAILRVEPQRTSYMAFTGADGRVTFAIPARGDVSVRFDGEVSGREPALLEARADGVSASSGEVVLRCRPVATGKSMSVRVLAADGTPIVDAKVHLWAWTTKVPDVPTGDDGVARFTDLVAREFSVTVDVGNGRYGPRGIRAVPDGQEVIARLPAVRVFTGEVVWESGEDAAQASVVAIRDGKLVWLATADAAGRFALEVPADEPGPYTLRVSAMRGTALVQATLGAVRPGDTIRVVLRPR
jgi:RNA polymerase sigma-70 factor (ECF subfamily)